MSYIPSIDLQPEFLTPSTNATYLVSNLVPYQKLLKTIQKINNIDQLTPEQKTKVIAYFETAVRWMENYSILDPKFVATNKLMNIVYERVSNWARTQMSEEDYATVESYFDDISDIHNEMVNNIHLYQTILTYSKN